MKNILSTIPLFFALILTLSSTVFASEAEYSKALYLISSKQYNEAITILNKLENDPEYSGDKSHLHFQLAVCYDQLGESEKAVGYAEQSIDENNEFDKPYLLLFDIHNKNNQFDEATYSLHSLVEVKPDSYEYFFTLGMMYGQYVKNSNLSVYSFEKVLEASEGQTIPPQYLENTYVNLSALYFERGDFKLAIETLNKAVVYNPELNGRFYNISNYFISKNMLKEAVYSVRCFVDNLTEEQKKNQAMLKVFAFLGRMYYLQDRPEALEYLRRGIDDPSKDGEICQALFDQMLGKNEKAQKELLALIDEKNIAITPYYALAKIYDDTGKKAEAYDYYISTALMLYSSGLDEACEQVLRKATVIKPKIQKVHEMLGRLHENQRQYSMAIYHYKLSDPDNEDLDTLLHIAYLYYFMEQDQEARGIISRAYKLDKQNPGTFFTDGVVLSSMDEHQAAVKRFEKAIQLEKGNSDYYFYLAMSQEKLKNYNGAVDSLKKAIELDDENTEYLNYLGYLYADNNDNLEESFKLLSKALSINPFNGAYLDSLGWLYYRKREYKQAEKLFIRAYRNLEAVDTYDPVVYDHLGDTYAKLGKAKRALHFWERALEYDKNNKTIQDKIKGAVK